MKECNLCNGAGLIGNGPNPHLLEGEKRTCPVCGGTGKIADGSEPVVAEPAPVEVPAESPKEVGDSGSLELSTPSSESTDTAGAIISDTTV